MASESVLCRYYMNGACRDGSQCRFSHNRNDRPSMICKYYQRGGCSYGTGCRYDHVRTERDRSANFYTNRRQSNAGASSTIAKHNRDAETSSINSRTSNNNNKPNNVGETSKMEDVVRKSKLRVEANEFVPRSSGAISNAVHSYSEAVSGRKSPSDEESSTNTKNLLCPYNLMGQCWYGDMCSFTHGEICDLCNQPALHPTNKEHNAKHRQECMAEHERNMEASFAVAKSKDKQCGICMEVVLDKGETTMQRFGILPSCKHCFCLECIRKWRQAKSFENKIIRACPECRTLSDYVVPSSVWVEDDDEKLALIETYLSALKEKKCKYFVDGKDECPFGNKCFYRHVAPDGTVVKGDSPRTIRRRLRHRQNGGGLRRYRHHATAGAASAANDLYVLWQFLEERDAVGGHRSRDSIGSADWLWDELEYELDMLSVTDDSDSDAGDYYDLILS